MKRILQVRGEQATSILGLLQQVATDEASLPLHEIHRETLLAMGEHLFQIEFDPDAAAPALADAGTLVSDLDLRRDVMNMAGILPFLEEDDQAARIDAVGRLAEAMDVDRKFVKELHGLCHEAVVGMAICLYRPFSLELGQALWKGPLKIAESFLHVDGDKAVLARYEGYRHLDQSTFGRVLVKYYDDNDFPLPGTPGAFFSNSLATHDIHHVLAGYPTSPLGETCIIAFDSALMDLDMGKALIGYVAQFQVGLQFDKGLRSWKNQFQPEVVLRAFERGGECTVDYLRSDFDFGDQFARPLAEVRRDFGIAVEGAVITSHDDPWCGQVGVVGQRSSPDLVERKKSILERMLAGRNTTD